MRTPNGCTVFLFVLDVVLFAWPSGASSSQFRHTHAHHHSQPQRSSSKLHVFASWNTLDFLFPSASARQEAISKGDFIPGEPVPIDTDVYYGIKDIFSTSATNCTYLGHKKCGYFISLSR